MRKEHQPIKSESNQRIYDFLEAYLKLSRSPQYAVLIDGEWGSGKTWFINQLKERIGKEKVLHISLYGITKFSQIEDQFFKQLNPILSSKPLSIGTDLLKQGVKFGLKYSFSEQDDESVTFDPTKINLKKFLTDTENKILIFDDLERCEMKIEKALGYINRFVEHRGQKVIVLANESEIKRNKHYRKKKEKVIGRTFTLVAEIDSAIKAFLDEIIDVRCKEVLIENKELLKSIFLERKYNNLRTLRQSILDYQRLFSSMPDKAQTNTEFQQSFILSFFSIALAVFNGKLAADNIDKFINKLIAAPKVTVKSGEKQSDGTILDGRLSPEDLIQYKQVLFNFFKFGSCPSEIIVDAINSSTFFKTDNTPDWMKLWHISSLREDEFKLIYPLVEQNFYSGKYVNEGELCHVCGTLLYLAKVNIIDQSYQETLQKVQQQVEKQITNGSIEPPEKRFGFRDSYAGLQFHEFNTPDFQKILTMIEDYQAEVEAKKIVNTAPQIIEWMKTEPSRLSEELLHYGVGNSNFKTKPALCFLSTEEFLNAFVEMDPYSRWNLIHIFAQRYETLMHYPLPAKELSWLQKLEEDSKSKSQTLKQPTKYALETFIKKGIEPSILKIIAFQKLQNERQQETTPPGT